MKVWGLTGGIGSGKSAVLREFKKRGAAVLDTDAVAREVVNPLTDLGRKTLAELSKEIGRNILKSDSSLDRVLLRDLLSQDPSVQRILEAILHPEILNQVESFIASHAGGQFDLCLIEGTRLVESGFVDKLQGLIMVEAPVELRIKRVMERDHVARALVERLIAIQDLEVMRKAATFFIENDSGLDQVSQKVDHFYKEMVSR